jgi:hypothetical protein
VSLADDVNTGGVCDAMAERFAYQDAARRAELDRLIRTGKGNEEPPKSGRESVMPRKAKLKRQARGPCEECGSPTCHKRTCSKRPGGPVAAPAAAPRPIAPKVKGAAEAQSRAMAHLAPKAGPESMSIADLVELRQEVDAELARRRAQLQGELAQLEQAIGSAA